MRKDDNGTLWYSPTDLVRFVESPYVSFMDRCYLEAPDSLTPDEADSVLELLAGKGNEHELRYLEALKADGRDVAEIPDAAEARQLTREAIEARRGVVFQACLELQPFRGFADFLEWDDETNEYVVWDTKLATSVKPYYLIQLCCYAEMLGAITGSRPAQIGVVLGTGERVTQRTDDFSYYYLHMKQAFLKLMEGFDQEKGPLPDVRADHGRWASHAAAYLEEIDHLIRVAGISRGQIRKLDVAGVSTLTELAQTTLERVPKLDRHVFSRLRAQAALQLESEAAATPAFEVIKPSTRDPRRGLALLPPPSPQDVFFDMEGDPLIPGGLEYLFGAVHLVSGEAQFWDAWGFDEAGEKAAFEAFVDWVIARWREDPSMHVYHYGSYEVTALKRLMGKFATREEEIDHLLRSDVLVDLLKIVTQGVRIGTRGYSLKDVETLYMTREGEVESGGESIVQFERFLASSEPRDWEHSPILEAIRDYNEADCDSTRKLVGWLRERRSESGVAWIPPGGEREDDVRPLGDVAQRRRDLAEQLLALAEGQDEGDATISTMLAHLVEFHRREEKPLWWSFFERHEMTPEQHVDDVTCIGKATLEEGPLPIKRSQGYWYRFDPDQDTKIEAGDPIYVAGIYEASMSVEALDPDGRIFVKVGPSKQAFLPGGEMPKTASFLRHKQVNPEPIPSGIEAVGAAWLERGELPASLRNLFAREAPPVAGHVGGALLGEGEDVLEGTSRIVQGMDGGTLCVQGPPGSGKTYAASHVIKALLDAGKDVGVVSNSHEAVFNVLRKVNQRDDGDLSCLKVGGPREHAFYDDCADARWSPGGAQGPANYDGGLIGGTAWLFARDDMAGRLDYLFVDEAGQISLANLVGMSRAARNLVLLGDQMQLAQPLQGTHPEDSGTSGLEYVLGEHATVPPELGILLPTTYRMHPEICSFISGAIYEDRLEAEPHTVNRVVRVPGAGGGSIDTEAGILFDPVEHDGNLQASEEEADRIAELAGQLVGRQLTDKRGEVAGPLRAEDILFVAPYNMQVRRLRDRLPAEARVASVDKFQGQQAPVVIVSLCRSAGEAESSARGLKFVLDRNRLNVAVSRAQSLAIVVGDPRLALTPANSVTSMRRLNLLARLMEESS